tara:strand:- start:81 stop:476 length:396 start_codon:yes stop_codon:yes gene_type:complete
MIYFLYFLIISCSSNTPNNTYIEKDYYPNGQLKYELQKQDGLIDGYAKYWDKNGCLINEVNYSNGVFHGTWKEYYRNGNLKSSIVYSYGLKDGYEYWYYDNGQKKSETLYFKGDIKNSTIRWNMNGELIYK